VEQNAHDHVARAATRKGNDDLDGASGIGLRRCQPRCGKSPDRDGGEMQKSTTRKSHGYLPLGKVWWVQAEMTDPFKPVLPSVFAHRVGHDTETASSRDLLAGPHIVYDDSARGLSRGKS